MTRPDQAREARKTPDWFPELDLVGLVAGLLALGIAAIYLMSDLAGRETQVGAIASYAVGVVAVAGLLAGLRRALGNRAAPGDRVV